jgi:KDO2-lipid IV(A) lauroyltransferase
MSHASEWSGADAEAVRRARLDAAPLLGKLIFHCFPIRRRLILENLRRVFAPRLSHIEIVRLAQAHYAHLALLLWEFVRFPWLSERRRKQLVRVENIEAILRVHERGKGVLILTGHLGNWEIATVAGLAQFPQYLGQLHVLRRRLYPDWLDRLVTRRFRRGGFGVLPKQGALDQVLDRLAAGDAVIFVLDQYAHGRDGVKVEFFGHATGTMRSLAILSRSTRIPVVPVSSWREANGRHVLRFEEPLPILPCENPNEGIRVNTRAYNAALERLILRHPEQWFWIHRRWKD